MIVLTRAFRGSYLPDNLGDIRDAGSNPWVKEDRLERMATASSCLQNHMDRGTRWPTVRRVAQEVRLTEAT